MVAHIDPDTVSAVAATSHAVSSVAIVVAAIVRAVAETSNACTFHVAFEA